MKKALAIFFHITSAVSYAHAQADSVAFVQADWHRQKVKNGAWWKHHEFVGNLFGSNQSINILEIKNTRRRKIDLGFEKQELKTTSHFGVEWKALAALNGTFFDVKNGGSVDYIRADGKVVSENRLPENGSRAVHQKAAIVLNHGRLRIEKWDGSTDWESKLVAEDVMLSGPLLVFHQTNLQIDSTVFAKSRHPRTAVAVTRNRLLFITVDGRDEHAAGMNLFELSRVLRWLHTIDGINLDGGGSTTLWIHGQAENGVVNYPCDDKVWNHSGERKVANVLLLKM